MEVQLEYLPNKTLPTWRVTQGTSQWFFTRNNGSIFDAPQDRAQRLYDKLKGIT